MEGFVLVTACWIAGVMEGASILSESPIKKMPSEILVPSLWYGTCALPLSILGASPGPGMISSLPQQQQQQQQQQRDDTRSIRTDLIYQARDQRRTALMSPTLPRRLSPWTVVMDGLPTPWAEAMRRTRFLLAGTGLVMAVIQWNERKVSKKDASITTRKIGRQNGERVILRLGSLPTTARDGIQTIPIYTTKQMIGNQPWHQLSIQDYSYTVDSSTSMVVLEADISPSIATYFEPNVQLPMAAANRIAHAILQQKTNHVVNLVVGVGPRPSLVDQSNTIYIDARSQLSTVVANTVESIDRNPTTKENEEQPTPSWLIWTVTLVESIGSTIRRGILSITGPSKKQQLHLLTDRRDICIWLQKSLPNWSIVWYNSDNTNDIRQYQIEANSQSITFVCCSNDDATVAFVLSSNQWGHVICLVEQEASETTIRSLISDENSISTLSLERVHVSLLDEASRTIHEISIENDHGTSARL